MAQALAIIGFIFILIALYFLIFSTPTNWVLGIIFVVLGLAGVIVGWRMDRAAGG